MLDLKKRRPGSLEAAIAAVLAIYGTGTGTASAQQ
jgi:hypothetical protein